MIKNYEKLASDITLWLKDYCLNSGLKGYTCGVSGGVDSAVISTLCAKTGLPLQAVTLPINSHPANQDNAWKQLNYLQNNYPNNVIALEVDLTPMYNAWLGLNRVSTELAKANTKCRLRHVFLYGEANTHNLLICLSGNKVEDMGVGFATKGGDLNCGDISPIADLTKTEVWELAKFLGIPQEIISAKPTDGLWDDPEHNDEAQIGATYPELEEAMKMYEHPDLHLGEYSERMQEVYRIYSHFHEKNKHKMLPIPVFKVDKEKYQ